MNNFKAPARLDSVCGDDVLVMAATIWGEARGEGFDGKLAVAWAIRNRAEAQRWYGIAGDGVSYPDHSLRAVCLKPWQFSAWNANDPNRAQLVKMSIEGRKTVVNYLEISAYRDCLNAALQVIDGTAVDPTWGSTHYFNPLAVDEPPAWAKNRRPVYVCGNHLFFNDVR